MDTLEEVFIKMFPDSEEAKNPKDCQIRNEKHEKGIHTVLNRHRRQMKKQGLSKTTIKDKLEGLEMYLRFQHDTGIPFGHPAYMSDGMAIYPDGRIEHGW